MIMKRMAIVIVFALGACVTSKQALYKDATGAGRQSVELNQDFGRCAYEIEMAHANRPQAPPPVYYGQQQQPYFQSGQPTYYASDPQMAASMSNLALAFPQGPSVRLLELCMQGKGWQIMGYE